MAAQRAGRQDRESGPLVAWDDTAGEVQAVAEAEWPVIEGAVHARLLSILTADYPMGETRLGPIEASALLSELKEKLEREAQVITRPYSPAQWLWYLRRLPDIFAGELSTTAPYDQMLTEILSAGSPAALGTWPMENGETVFPVTEGVVRRVLRLCATATALSSLHSVTRRAGKGQRVDFSGARFPETVRDTATDSAIELYDNRVAEGPSGIASGTRIFRPFDGRTGALPFTLVARLPQWDVVKTFVGPLHGGSEITVLGHYAPVFLQADGLERIVSGAPVHARGWWHPELPALVALVQGLSLYLTLHTTHGWLSLSRYGYLTMRTEDLRSFIDFVLPGLHDQLDKLFPGVGVLDAEDVIQTLSEGQARRWPVLPGPIFRMGADKVLVDLDAASQRLAKLLVVAPSGGPLANERADHFEDVVQELIDTTDWRPSSGLRNLRKKTLRLTGNVSLTDLDALGELDGTLLIVSCKSFPITLEYDAGDYPTVRNVTSTMSDAVKKWDQVVETLTEARIGQNFDLRAYRNILGVVCTPAVAYMPLGSGTEVKRAARGHSLRAVSSYAELASWLRS